MRVLEKGPLYMKSLRLLCRPGTAAVLSKIISALFSFAFIWSVTQVLKPSDAGIFLYTYTIMMVLVQLSRAGSDNSMVKILSSATSKLFSLRVVCSTVLYVSFVASILVSLYLIMVWMGLFPVYSSQESINTLFLFLVIVFLFSYCQILASYFQSRIKVYSQYWALGVGVSLAGVFVSLLFFLNEKDVGHYVYSLYFLFSVLMVLVVSIVVFFKSLSSLDCVNDNAEKVYKFGFSEIIGTTLPFASLAFINIIVQWGGQLLSGVWLSEDLLAVLSVAVRISMLVGFLFLAFSSLTAPIVASIFKNNRFNEIYALTGSYYVLTVLYSTIVFVFFLVAGDWVLNLFGSSYVSGYLSLIIMSSGWWIRSLFGPVGTILLMTDNVKVSRVNLYISGSVTLTIGVVFIDLYGIEGAALSTAVGGVTLSVLNYIMAKRRLNICYFTNVTYAGEFRRAFSLISRK